MKNIKSLNKKRMQWTWLFAKLIFFFIKWKITLFSTFNMADYVKFYSKNYFIFERVLCCALFLLNYLVSRCLVSSECVAEAQYCCRFSFSVLGLANVWRNGNSTAQFGEIYNCIRTHGATNRHTHTSISAKLLWTGANEEKIRKSIAPL